MSKDLASYYKTVWFQFLSVIANWPTDKIAALVYKFDNDLKSPDPNNIFFHRSPLYYVVAAVIPQHFLTQNDGADYLKIKADVEMAVTDHGKLSLGDSQFDWHSARTRVLKLLSTIEKRSRDAS